MFLEVLYLARPRNPGRLADAHLVACAESSGVGAGASLDPVHRGGPVEPPAAPSWSAEQGGGPGCSSPLVGGQASDGGVRVGARPGTSRFVVFDLCQLVEGGPPRDLGTLRRPRQLDETAGVGRGEDAGGVEQREDLGSSPAKMLVDLLTLTGLRPSPTRRCSRYLTAPWAR